MQIIDWRKFVATSSTLDKKAFIVSVAYSKGKILIYPAWKVQITLLLRKKFDVLKEYIDFVDIFFK